MPTATIKKQFDAYLPLLTESQQSLLLEMVKRFLNVDANTKRISRKQYNKELEEAVGRIESGEFVTHEEAMSELAKW
jgi:hypothetical protein